MKLDYKIVRGYDYDELETKVRKSLEEGWRPTGGVSNHIYDYEKYENRDGETKIAMREVCYMQAMIKEISCDKK